MAWRCFLSFHVAKILAAGRRVKSMCLSEGFSFGVGGGLVAAGVFASWKAFAINKRNLPIAI
jgi:hypothetical protein